MPEDEDLEKQQEAESTRKAVDTGVKAAADYFTGGQGGQIIDAAKKVPGVGKKIDKAEDKIGKKLNKATGGKFGDLAKKADDSGALDMANSALSMGKGGTGANGAQGPSPISNNGKNILNNSPSISNPEGGAVANNFGNDNGTIDDQMAKNAARQAVGAHSVMIDSNEEEQINDEPTSPKTEGKEKDNKPTDTLFDVPFNKKVIPILFLSIGVVAIFIVLIVIPTLYVNDFSDLVAIGSSGLNPDIDTIAKKDPELKDMYNRILDKQSKYAEKKKVFSADLIVSIYHVLAGSNNVKFKPKDMNDGLIDEIVSYMFEENCDVCTKEELDEDGNCPKVCTYDEALFKDNLENKFFIKYMSANSSKKSTQEVFDYIERFRDYIGYTGMGSSGGMMCSDISLTSTSLSKSDFVSKVQAYASSSGSAQVFGANAEKIYDISVSNNFNPEMVLIRAIAEGFSPGGGTYNYWGLGCTNTGGGRDCQHYASFDAGVMGYINNIKSHGYTTLYSMMNKYAYIGSYWYNPGSSGKGGCYYFPYVSKYMSSDRSAAVASACQSGKTCTDSACLKTTDEDQDAYTKYQSESMLSYRSKVFNISSTDCVQVGGSGNISSLSDIVNYAVATFDNYRYSQSMRMQDGYVDCSSLVYRVYSHFGINMSGSTSGEEYRWCENSGKTISASELQPGDLIFFNSGSHSNSRNYKNIGHVEMYYGPGQTFGAHTSYSDYTKDVSISSYNNSGNLFCRPTK